METRSVGVRLAAGDSYGLTAWVGLTHGDQTGKFLLHPGLPSVEWSYEVTDEELQAGRTGFSFCVEYEWGWAREASHQGDADTDTLILPIPGGSAGGSFPFPRRS